MPFQKGIVKKGGRKPGSLNKNTKVMLAFVDYIVSKGYEDADEIWADLKAKDKMDAMIKMFEYRMPKHARVEYENKMPSSVTINFLPATPELIEQNNTIDISHEEVND
jgi:hypothetical protein